jgi:hypothetical protein
MMINTKEIVVRDSHMLFMDSRVCRADFDPRLI